LYKTSKTQLVQLFISIKLLEKYYQKKKKKKKKKKTLEVDYSYLMMMMIFDFLIINIFNGKLIKLGLN
jgi:hypothetical protein